MDELVKPDGCEERFGILHRPVVSRYTTCCRICQEVKSEVPQDETQQTPRPASKAGSKTDKQHIHGDVVCQNLEALTFIFRHVSGLEHEITDEVAK